MSEHERLHERLLNGTADAGMYPDHWYQCLGREEEQRRREDDAESERSENVNCNGEGQ